MNEKQKQTRPSKITPIAVRFTASQLNEIESIAEEFQISKQDAIRLATSAGLKAMKKIGLNGLHVFLTDQITAPTPEVDAPPALPPGALRSAPLSELTGDDQMQRPNT